MKIITQPVILSELWENRDVDFTEMMKIVVDVKQEILAIDAEMHADLEQDLLAEGSQQQDLWGANIYPLKEADDRLEYTSFINIRPSQGNSSMEVIDPGIRNKIAAIADHLLI
ncbi:MAG: DUF5674 family protein [Bacteroidales bacterium]